MDSEGDRYFTNLLNEESTFDEQESEQFTVDYSNRVGGSQQVPIEESPSTGKKKGGNFFVEEDELLVLAWLNTSIDFVIGTRQKNVALWKRILLYYNKYKTFESTRNHNSLMNHWSMIQCATNKFCGSIAQVSLTGSVKQDRIAQAKRLYLEVHNSNFQFMHYWVILREEPKWLDESNKQKKKKKNNNAASSPSTPKFY
ncbi:hypothetical protein L1049_027847 [Liquidambar formosana]|uniref:No apical meristem-associated C-terminal domain-containing protein n=1 Tax=Liquidambar formosana TaxID=63359 RepID=A0AAP0RJH7_LIQFO